MVLEAAAAAAAAAAVTTHLHAPANPVPKIKGASMGIGIKRLP